MAIINPSFVINSEKKDNQILINTPYIYNYASFPHNIFFIFIITKYPNNKLILRFVIREFIMKRKIIRY